MLVRISQHRETAAPAEPAPPPTRSSRSAEVTVTFQVRTDYDQAPTLAAHLAKAIRAALGPAIRSELAIITDAALPSSNETASGDDTAQPRLPRPRSASSPAAWPLLQIVVAARRVVRDNHPLDLTRLEFDLLLFLCQHPHQVHPRKALMTRVWGEVKHDDSRTVDVHVRPCAANSVPSCR